MLDWARAYLRRLADIERTVLATVIVGAAALFTFAAFANAVGRGSTRPFDVD